MKNDSTDTKHIQVKTIDIIAAIRNEESNISRFITGIRGLNKPGVNIHIILIEDGSTDNTVGIMKEMAIQSNDISFYSLKNPYGQGLALAYGLLQSNGDASITIDADGSHPYKTAEQMIQEFLNGADIVQGNRISYDRKSIYRKIGSKIYFFLFTLITGVNLYKQNVHFRLMNRKATILFKQNRRWWYSLRTKFNRSKKLVVEYVDFIAPERVSGTSKFNFLRLFIFAYNSFLTLIGIPTFIFINLIASILIFPFWFIMPAFCIISYALLALNIVAFIRKNSINYLNMIKPLYSYKAQSK